MLYTFRLELFVTLASKQADDPANWILSVNMHWKKQGNPPFTHCWWPDFRSVISAPVMVILMCPSEMLRQTENNNRRWETNTVSCILHSFSHNNMKKETIFKHFQERDHMVWSTNNSKINYFNKGKTFFKRTPSLLSVRMTIILLVSLSFRGVYKAQETKTALTGGNLRVLLYCFLLDFTPVSAGKGSLDNT